jgi:two-component system cell cycle sensor histidine kinase/response regulator CckA
MDAPRILVVDDDAAMAALIANVLRIGGYAVVELTRAGDALARADAGERFDLAILDVVMPQLTGDALALSLRRTQPDLPILYVTGFDEALFKARPLLWKGESFLAKPFSLQSLTEAVSLALHGTTSATRDISDM